MTISRVLYNSGMPEFKFTHPIEIRYEDLDPQGHLNNAKYLTYFEQARIFYLERIGVFSHGQSFLEIGVILADVHISYHAPVHFGMQVSVGVRTSRLGNKSMTVEQAVLETGSGRRMATGEVVMVTYDYYKDVSIPIPDDWREKITRFEGL